MPPPRSPDTTTDSTPRVLSTLNTDGSRRWLFPRVSPGRFLTRRRVIAYALLILYTALPWIRINGQPSILLDLPRREFTFFGTTFLPTDTRLLMLFIAAVFVTVFLVTALFGRLWCGWACPQTVYLEFIYRPIERLFDGRPDARGRVRRKKHGLRTALKYLVFFLISLHLAHTFLAYFVGAANLFDWTRQSPFEHPTAFLIVAGTTGLIMFDFCFFREQTCIVACPYGRLQSVMLDRQSLIIGYDQQRGEPRGKVRRAKSSPQSAARDVDLTVSATATPGDCIDCSMCVTTCPTGIDIREGLQMECVGCAQCIDACDAVMTRIGRPKGLIRYSSQEAMEDGRRRLVRPRVIVYPLMLLVIVGAFVMGLVNRPSADITLLSSGGRPYITLADGMIANDVRVKIVNRTEATRVFDISISGLDGAHLRGDEESVSVPAGASVTVLRTVVVPADVFSLGRAVGQLEITDDADFRRAMRARLQGPFQTGAAPAARPEEDAR